LYAPDDGRGDARNMLSHTWTSSNKLVKLLQHLVGWFIWIIWWCTDLQASNCCVDLVHINSGLNKTELCCVLYSISISEVVVILVVEHCSILFYKIPFVL